ncbi:RNA 2',3'-cyclic phosphodiesterase [Paenibacillus silviterrae]|uniref:RNA 2',3'-cyclic phosphodiesterase n=1 Tax=Paenibacillus silviterrae TaxID=3242194 RepID=UPI00254367F8|nr:RNA 2',3'-cyclic phosphodiesterase [Paenibacillus chinjuensis]
MSELRLFIAVPIPSRVKDSLKGYMLDLQASLSFQKWVHPDDLHITLKFLGGTPVKMKEKLEEQLASLANGLSTFHLSVGELGAFGKPAAPGVLQAGVHGDTDALKHMHRRVEQLAAAHGFAPEERPYKPHITLARRYVGSEPFQRLWTQEAVLPASGSWSWEVNEIVLYQSHLGRRPMYHALHTFPLQGQPALRK